MDNGAEVDTDTLDVGDFVIQGLGLESNVCVERKDIGDFIQSGYGRLWEQVKALSNAKGQEYTPVIIVEGVTLWDNDLKKPIYWVNWLKRHPDKESSFYQMQWGVGKWQVITVMTKDEKGTACFILDLDRKLGKPTIRRELPTRSGFKRGWSLEQKRLYLLQAFGAEVGKSLLKNWDELMGNLKAYAEYYNDTIEDDDKYINEIANFTLDSGRRVGRKKAEEVYTVLFKGGETA